MSECPYCGTAMEPGSIAQQPYEGCPGCGGVWIGAESLGLLVSQHPERLAELDDTWPDHDAKPSLDRFGVVCPETGDELVKKAFPAAPQQPILASPKAKKLFFKHGELRTLHGHVSPNTLPPPPRPVAPVPDHIARQKRIEEAQAEQNSSMWSEALGTKWPEPGDGQTWLSWFVCGMPLWVAGVLLLLPAILGTVLLALVSQAMGSDGLSSSSIPVWAAFPATYLAWPMVTFLLAVTLMIVWALAEGAPPLSFGHIFLLLLKVQAVLITFDALISLLFLAGLNLLWLILMRFIARLVIYRLVLELEWYEILLLAWVGSYLGRITGMMMLQ